MKKNRLFKFAIVLVILFAGWILIAPFLAKALIVEKPLPHADAILVLGGSASYIERTDKAAELFNSGITAKVILTDDGTRGGWLQIEQRNMPFIELARRNLIARGVPAENIEIIKPAQSGTFYEAKVLAEKVGEENLNTVLIVTSAYHTRRAFWIVSKIFADENVKTEIGIVSPPAGIQTPAPLLWWLKSKGWGTVAGEYVKTFGYWMFY